MIRGRFALRQMAVASVHDAMEKKSDRKDLLGRLLEEVEAGTDNKGRSFDPRRCSDGSLWFHCGRVSHNCNIDYSTAMVSPSQPGVP